MSLCVYRFLFSRQCWPKSRYNMQGEHVLPGVSYTTGIFLKLDRYVIKVKPFYTLLK